MEEQTDSEYIKLLKLRLKLESKKPDKSSNLYDIASGGLTLVLGITVLALGSAASFGAPAIAIGICGAAFAGYKEYKRRKLAKEIAIVDKQISSIETKFGLDLPTDEKVLANNIKNQIDEASHKKRKVSNFVEMAFGAFGVSQNAATIIIGVSGLCATLMPYASIGIAAVGLGVFGYKEYRRIKEERKEKERKIFGDYETKEMTKTPELLQDISQKQEQKISTHPQKKPKIKFTAKIQSKLKSLSFAKTVKQEKETQEFSNKVL